MTLTEIAALVAARLNYSFEEAWAIADEMTKEITRQLNAGEEVRVRGLGTFYWADVTATRFKDVHTGKLKTYPSGLKLKFRPAVALRQRRVRVEKLGVVLDEDKVKQAEQGGTSGSCPRCGRALSESGRCDEHGTEPMEKRPPKKES